MSMQDPQNRPFSVASFQRKLDKFEEYIAEVTLQDHDVSTEEKRQIINESLRYESFCDVIQALFGSDIKTQDTKAIFRKISTNPDVKIDWSEVFGYFQVENTEQESNEEVSVFTVSKRKKVGEAAGDKKRRDTIQSVIYSPEFDIYLTASQKGALSIYTGKLRLQNCIDVNESAWMTSCEYLPKLRKVIATTERSIVIWDHRAKANDQSSLYVIKPLEHSPQCMCLVPSKDDHSDSVLIGDDAGYVNLVRLTPNDFASSSNKDPKRAMMCHVIDPTSLTVPIVRRRFHTDWVLKIEYLHDLKAFASCSPSDKTSFVIAEFKRMFDAQPFRELSITRGVNAFAYSEKSNIFATGGVDKIIRVWHPNILSRPTGKMIGHLFTIIAVVINDKDQHIVSLSTARVFRVWDIHTLTCLQVFTDNDRKSGDRRISCLLFDSRHDRLFTGSNSIDMWPMTRTVQDTMSVPHTHDNPLTVITYNRPVSQLITACSESVIKVWEIDTGRQMYQILEAHGLGIEMTSASVDVSGTRMITGAYDGSMKVWEFSSGQELKNFVLDPPHEDDQTVFWISYIQDKVINVESQEEVSLQGEDDTEDPSSDQQMTICRRVLAFGWNNKLKEFKENDSSDEIEYVREFSGNYEWPPTPPPSPDPTVTSSYAELDEDVEARKKKKQIGDEELIPRKEDLLLRHEITCCTLMDDNPQLPERSLITGCSNGNIIVWDYDKGSVLNMFELDKAELPSRYDSRQRRMKEMYPYRVNAVACMKHKIFRPDPEELKRRRKLRKKKLQEMEQENCESEAEETNNAQNEDSKKDSIENANDHEKDDPAEEIEISVEDSDEESSEGENTDERPLSFELNQEPIKMVEVNFSPIIASSHQDSCVRLWSTAGELLMSLSPMTKIVSPITTMCCDEYSNYLIVADSKGYVTMWDVSEFLERAPTSSAMSFAEMIKLTISWRAHLMKIVSMLYVDTSGTLITASNDGSVRVWYPQKAHYIGYFGQHRVWNLAPNPSLPSSPVLPYDINEGPSKPINMRSGRRKPQTKKYEYPLVFDAERWRPFRRSAYIREKSQLLTVTSNAINAQVGMHEVRNKKFFNALIKPKADKSSLESSKPAEPESGAIFRALPVYRLKTPPPQPRPPTMDFVTGGAGASWNDDTNSARTPGKPGTTGKVGRGKLAVKKVTMLPSPTPVVASGASKRRRVTSSVQNYFNGRHSHKEEPYNLTLTPPHSSEGKRAQQPLQYPATHFFG